MWCYKGFISSNVSLANNQTMKRAKPSLELELWLNIYILNISDTKWTRSVGAGIMAGIMSGWPRRIHRMAELLEAWCLANRKCPGYCQWQDDGEVFKEQARAEKKGSSGCGKRLTKTKNCAGDSLGPTSPAHRPWLMRGTRSGGLTIQRGVMRNRNRIIYNNSKFYIT